jgi:putative hydrolase of the HAD superfamily
VAALIHPRPTLLLLDFDGVLAAYSRAARIAHLAAHCGCEPARVREVLFVSALETAYDSGDIATAAYLQRLGEGLGAHLDEAAWIAARVAGSRGDPGVIECVLALANRIDIGVLTNNGALMAQAIPQIVPTLFPLLRGRVLCSGALGGRKQDAAGLNRAQRRGDDHCTARDTPSPSSQLGAGWRGQHLRGSERRPSERRVVAAAHGRERQPNSLPGADRLRSIRGLERR